MFEAFEADKEKKMVSDLLNFYFHRIHDIIIKTCDDKKSF